MVKTCCVKGCKSESYQGCGVSFHMFPKNESLKKKWIDVVPGKFSSSASVCGLHFKDEDFALDDHTLRKRLKANVVPSIFPVVDVAPAEHWIKLESNTHETEVVYVKGEPIEIETTVQQPEHPVAIMPTDDAASTDWIKREHNTYKTEELHVEDELEIEPPVLQPHHPVAVIPKMEPTSGERESSVEEPTPSCSSGASTVSHAGDKHAKRSRASEARPIKAPRVCKGNTPCPSSPKSHKRACTGERTFSCTNCDATFTVSSRLKKHMRIHTGERPFSCTTCDATFNQSGSLKSHMRLHTGERPFSCTICDATFTVSGSLKSHMLKHTGERPFSCTICDATFTQSSSLKSHMLIHTGERPFSCTICDAKFTVSSSLKNHIRIHTGERPFRCTICDATFTQSGSLKSHTMLIHTR